MTRVCFICLLILPWLLGCATDSVNYKTKETAIAANAAYNRLGVEYLQLGDTSKAKRAFRKSLSFTPDDAQSHNGLGLVFQLEGDMDLAARYFRQALDLAPQSAMIKNNAGAFFFAIEDYATACKLLHQAAADPFYNQRAQAFENLARCYRRDEKIEAAIKAFKRALQINAQRVLALVELADLYLQENNFSAAELYFKRFVKLFEQNKVKHYAKSLWVGIRIAKHRGAIEQVNGYSNLLQSQFPDSSEYKLYERLL